MAQFSVKIMRLTSSLLGENQQTTIFAFATSRAANTVGRSGHAPSMIVRTLPSMRFDKTQFFVFAPTARRKPRASGSVLSDGSVHCRPRRVFDLRDQRAGDQFVVWHLCNIR